MSSRRTDRKAAGVLTPTGVYMQCHSFLLFLMRSSGSLLFANKFAQKLVLSRPKGAFTAHTRLNIIMHFETTTTKDE
jgi:hypothetical protein